MARRTRRGLGRAVRRDGAGDAFPTPQFVRDELGNREGVIELLRKLGYKVENADESEVRTSFVEAAKGFKVQAVQRIVRHVTLGRDVRVWLVEVDHLRNVTAANSIIQRAKRFQTGYQYLLVVTDYDRFLWVCPQGQVTYKLWFERERVYHSDLQTLAMLGLSSPEADLVEITQKWRDAFSTERVTNAFYQDYVAAQDALETAIKGLPAGEKGDEARGEYAQLLMGRLMFLYFLQKKGWLGREGQTKKNKGKLNPDYDYLQRKYREVCEKSKGKAFYDRFLKRLFFRVLCVDRRERGTSVTREFGEIPFLNGGLFHKCDIEKRYGKIGLPDKAFDLILSDDIDTGLFVRYNFTVREDEPLDRQVAVDPEMLGKVFEQQVVRRQSTGAFYTPQPVVDYMCRESLKAFLLTRAAGDGDTPVAGNKAPISREAILNLVEMMPSQDEKASKVSKLSDEEAIRLDELLDGVAIIDPAVGSGAFLVGTLHRLVDLRSALIRRSIAVTKQRVKALNKGQVGKHAVKLKETAPSDSSLRYVLKRRIIQRNLYGVDIDRGAIQIAQLRLWLSLSVEHEVEYVDHIQPLPNLDLNLIPGNSLVDTFRPKGSKEALDLELDVAKAGRSRRIDEIVADIKKLHTEYTNLENEEEKDNCLKEVENQFRELWAEEIDQAIRDVDHKISSLTMNTLGMDLLVKSDERRLEYLKHQRQVLPKAKKAVLATKQLDYGQLPMLWGLRFPDIFSEKGGFDICIANPPYISTQGASGLPYTDDLKEKMGFNDDHYVFFTYRALGHPERERMLPITRPDGIACFITSDTYFTLSSKEHMRRLLQSRRLLKIGQVDPFRATVDAAIYLVQNRERVDGEPAEFFQARFVDSHDDLAQMSDRLGGKGSAKWEHEADFTLPASAAARPRPKRVRKKDKDQGLLVADADAPPLPSEAGGEPVASERDASLKGTTDGKRSGLWRYRVIPTVWQGAVREAIFEPSARNAALYNRFMPHLRHLVTEWWSKIETSHKFEQHLDEIGAYQKMLMPGDVTVVGLVCEVAQGMSTGNNARFLGYLEGSKEAEDAIARREILLAKWDASATIRRSLRAMRKKRWEYGRIAHELRQRFSLSQLGVKRSELHWVVKPGRRARTEKLSEDARRKAVREGLAGSRTWVPYRKGDREGHRWCSRQSLYIDWSRENARWLYANSGRRGTGMPVVRNPHLFLTEGLEWSRIGRDVPLKVRLQPACVFDSHASRLNPMTASLGVYQLLAILNSPIITHFSKKFLNNTNYELSDIRLLPLVIPDQQTSETLASLARQAVEAQRRITGEADAGLSARLAEIENEISASVEELYDVAGKGPFDEF